MNRFIIFLPVYNGEKYIEAAIESIVKQMYLNWMLVIIDNASIDSTAKIIKKYLVKYQNINCLHNEITLSIEKNWSRILDYLLVNDTLAKEYKYMTIIGHDDILYPEFLQNINESIISDTNAKLYTTNYNIIDSRGVVKRRAKAVPCVCKLEDYFVLRYTRKIETYGTGFVFKVVDFKSIGGYPILPKLLYSDDLFIIRIIRNSYIRKSENIGFCYRLHSLSVSGKNPYIGFNDLLTSFLIYWDIIKYEFISEINCNSNIINAFKYYVEYIFLNFEFFFKLIKKDKIIIKKLQKVRQELAYENGYLISFSIMIRCLNIMRSMRFILLFFYKKGGR